MRKVRHLVVAAGLALAAAPLASAVAQDTPAGVRPYRFTVSGHLANYWLDRGEGGDRASVGGYGLRVMFNRSDVAETARGFFGRASTAFDDGKRGHRLPPARVESQGSLSHKCSSHSMSRRPA